MCSEGFSEVDLPMEVNASGSVDSLPNQNNRPSCFSRAHYLGGGCPQLFQFISEKNIDKEKECVLSKYK